jgi:hypothetical protein
MIATPQPGTCQTCLYWESDAEQAGRCLRITLYKGAPASGGDATEAAYLEAYDDIGECQEILWENLEHLDLRSAINLYTPEFASRVMFPDGGWVELRTKPTFGCNAWEEAEGP